MSASRSNLNKSPNNSVLVIALLISLLIHYLLVVKIRLPLQHQKNSQSNKPFQIKLIANQNPVSQSIPDLKFSTEEESTGSQHTAKSVITKSVTEQPTRVSSQILNITESSPAPGSNNVEIKVVDHTQPEYARDQMVPATNIKIEFQIVSGKDGKLLDSGQQHFVIDEKNSYQLNINGNHSTGDDAHENWDIGITGNLYANGLSPYSYYTNGKQAYNLLRLNRTSHGEPIRAEPTSGVMPDGILDRQSLVYQFMFLPPTSRDTKLFLTDGAKVSTYTVHLLNTELLDTATYGKLSTAHIVLSNFDSSETIDLWLASNFRYLPIKIRYTEPDGTVTEQLTQRIYIQ